jgi:peptidoglycan/LPS O-acetylase OafA/YrhL
MRFERIAGGVTIAEAMRRPFDNFTLLRLVLASAVVVSHAFSVTTGRVADEPLMRLTGFTLGEHAVNGFFAISGFLVAMSFDRRGARDYVLARTLRIFPGLIAAVLFTALVLGAAMTRLPLASYFQDPSLWRFVSTTIGSFKSTAPLPGVFEDNPFRFSMGTVWTLKYEVICYVGVLAAGLLGLLRRPPVAAAFVAVMAVCVAGLALFLPDAGKGTQTTFRLVLLFSTGSGLYVWRNRVRLSPAVMAGVAAAVVLLSGTVLYEALLYLATAYGVLWIAMAPGLARREWEPPMDLSYGVYLYGWPIQQALHALFPAASAWTLLVPSLVLSAIVAAASWVFVEKPALGIKARLVKAAPPRASPHPNA